MTSVMNPYDALYTNLKNQFTVIYNGSECTVGDFMLMKANKRSESSLPIVTTHRTTSIASIVEYVNDKLTVKKAPVKDQTIKSFPVRTSLSALLSATAACALVFSMGVFALSGNNSPYTAENTTSEYTETVAPDGENSVEYEFETQEK